MLVQSLKNASLVTFNSCRGVATSAACLKRKSIHKVAPAAPKVALVTDQKRGGDPDAPELLERKWQLDFNQRFKHTVNPLYKARPKHERKFENKTGVVYSKVPFKMEIKQGKMYKWCSCGRAKTQPLCDHTCRIPVLHVQLRPMYFKAPKTQTVHFCNCKQTNNPPFCDGTHRDIAE